MEIRRTANLGRLTTLTLVASLVVAVAAGCRTHASPVTQAAGPAGPMVCTLPRDPSLSPARNVRPGHADLSGTTRVGKASFYAHSFANRVMANGRRMNPRSDNAASRTLPLGTTAKVTNVATGQTAVVSIEDRGPYVSGRIVDLSPATARQIGLTRRIGVAQVKIAPIEVALPDGTLKPGSGAHRVPHCRVYTSSSDVLTAVNREPEHTFQ